MAASLAALVSACTGRIGAGSDPPTGGDSGPPTTKPDSGAPVVLGPGRSPLRRLTRTEYNNTVRVLLGDDSRPAAQFETDVISDGFTNNADTQNVGTNLAQQYLTAAEALSVAATRDLPGLLGCDPTGAAEATCLREFITRFGRRAWRRPLAADEVDRLATVFSTGRMSFDVATSTQMVLQALLLSPHFLYRIEKGLPPASMPAAPGAVALSSWEIASRLSYFLMGAMPDDGLFTAAEQDALRTPEQIAAQASRLLSSATTTSQELAQARYAQFFTEWLHLVNIDKLQKDPTLFPEYSPALAAQMKAETETFVKRTLFGGAGDLATLLGAPYTYATADVARLYGATAPAGDAPARIELDPAHRAGLLTQPALLATFAKADVPDPVHRGKFVWESLLCGTVPAPPANAKITVPTITPGTTARERFQQHRSDPACATCHVVMDPIGLAFENYDALGRWRDREGTLAIDASGTLVGTDVDGTFVGVPALAQKLAGSGQVAACAVRQLFRFAFGRFETADDEPTLTDLAGRFETGKRQMVDLAVAVTQTPGFRQLRISP